MADTIDGAPPAATLRNLAHQLVKNATSRAVSVAASEIEPSAATSEAVANEPGASEPREDAVDAPIEAPRMQPRVDIRPGHRENEVVIRQISPTKLNLQSSGQEDDSLVNISDYAHLCEQPACPETTAAGDLFAIEENGREPEVEAPEPTSSAAESSELGLVSCNVSVIENREAPLPIPSVMTRPSVDIRKASLSYNKQRAKRNSIFFPRAVKQLQSQSFNPSHLSQELQQTPIESDPMESQLKQGRRNMKAELNVSKLDAIADKVDQEVISETDSKWPDVGGIDAAALENGELQTQLERYQEAVRIDKQAFSEPNHLKWLHNTTKPWKKHTYTNVSSDNDDVSSDNDDASSDNGEEPSDDDDESYSLFNDIQCYDAALCTAKMPNTGDSSIRKAFQWMKTGKSKKRAPIPTYM